MRRGRLPKDRCLDKEQKRESGERGGYFRQESSMHGGSKVRRLMVGLRDRGGSCVGGELWPMET